MKRLFAMLLALLLLALPWMAAADGLEFTAAPQEDGSLILYFDDLSLTLPAGWGDKALAIPGDGGLSFYQRESYERYQAEGIEGGGFLFSLGASVNGSFSQLPAFEYLGYSEDSAMNYYLALPTDYPAYNEESVRAEYDKMLAQVDAIARSAVFYDEPPATEPSDGGVSLEQARYYFEHNALPRYFYDDPANLMQVLGERGMYGLWAAFADENGVAYPYTDGDFGVRRYDLANGAAMLQIELPEPEANTLCYRLYMLYGADTGDAGYYTVEYDNLLGDAAFLCGWTRDHDHVNYGGAAILNRSDSGYGAALAQEAAQVAELAGSAIAASPTASGDALMLIECPEMGFSTRVDPDIAWKYEAGTGVYLYTEHAGSIPYVILYHTGDVIAEPMDYIIEQFTPHMRQEYGDDLVAVNELEDYEIGGRKLPAGLYTYKLQGHLVDMLRLYDITQGGTMAYTAKYLDGEGAATLEALDTAIRNLHVE